MAEWDVRHEIERLNGELFAFRAMQFYFLQRMFVHAPDIVRLALDDAANHAEALTISHGKNVSPHHLAKALEIIEDFRSQIVKKGWGSTGLT